MTLQNEVWKDIEGYEGWYQVSNLGNIKSLKRRCRHGSKWSVICKEKILKPSIHGKGYLFVRLYPTEKTTKKRGFEIHRLVANAFIENTYNKPQVDHINRDKTDNRVENLRWVNNSENQSNTKANFNIFAFGKTQTITEWSREYNISTSSIKIRLKKGFSPEDAISLPPTNNSTRNQLFRK